MREDGAPRLHSAWLACIARAFNLDARIGVDAVLGFTPVGRVPASGAFPPLTPEVRGRAAPSAQRFAQFEFDELDHAAWNAELERSVRDGGGRQVQSEQKQEGMQAVWDATLKEVNKGTMSGPFAARDLDRAYGAGQWRAIRRFPIWQKEKCRPCDDCAESGHNAASFMAERLRCNSADFPAAVACLCASSRKPRRTPSFSYEAALMTSRRPIGGRRVPCACPNFTVVCAVNPTSGEPCFFTLAGLNFGLASAPVLFSRIPRLAVHLLRRVLAVPVTSFYDDFCTCDPWFAGSSGQDCLWHVMHAFGMPLAKEKHQPMSTLFTFLGVEIDLRHLPSHGVLTLGISRERCYAIARIPPRDRCHFGRGGRSSFRQIGFRFYVGRRALGGRCLAAAL